MPSPIGHTLAGYCVYEAQKKPGEGFGWKKFAAFTLLANLPDLHYVPALLIGNADRFRYAQLHSIGFAFIVSAAVYIALKIARHPKAFGWALAGLTLVSFHLLLDWLCKNNYPSHGIMLFWPFSDWNYTCSVHLFADLQKDSLPAIFSRFNLERVFNEIVILGVVFLVVQAGKDVTAKIKGIFVRGTEMQ